MRFVTRLVSSDKVQAEERLIASALETRLGIRTVLQEVRERRQEEGPESSPRGIRVREGVALEKGGEKALHDVLGCLVVVTVPPDEEVERLPVDLDLRCFILAA
jgi:hypothetical protein